jgi:hypothetical protein
MGRLSGRAAIGLTGCAQVWGHDTTSGTDAIPLPPEATLQLDRGSTRSPRSRRGSSSSRRRGCRSDGLTVTIDPAKPVELTLVADRTQNTLDQFNVFEVAANAAMTAIELEIVYAAYRPAPMIVVPHDVFETCKVYMVRALHRGRVPDARRR